MIPLRWLISGQARRTHFDAIHGDPARVADRQAGQVRFETIYGDSASVVDFVHVRETHFYALYGHPALVSDIRTSLEGTF